MHSSNIKFKKADEEMTYKPEQKIDTFYQICQFKNQFTKKHGTRKVVFDEQGNILKTFEREYSYQKLEEFMRRNRSTKYKIYPTHDISIVDLPGGEEMICVHSELLNNDIREYDNQKWINN